MASVSPVVSQPKVPEAAKLPSATDALAASQKALARELRRITRFATIVVVISAPSVFFYLTHYKHFFFGKALLVTFIACIAFRGAIDIIVRKMIPWPSLFGLDEVRLAEEDIVNRRRVWTWSRIYTWVFRVVILISVIFGIKYFSHWWSHEVPNPVTWTATASHVWERIQHFFKTIFSASGAALVAQIFFLFAANILLFLGPILLMGLMQVKVFEPGDAEWGVKLDDVRGQPEAKEDIRRVVTLWQSGDLFEKSGGKRERGLLFLGAPGTGKTMMAKAIATSFNSPFVTIPGSGFAQTFIGVDVIVVRWLAFRARRMARKWGGTCLVFIDEIDAIGMRRQSLAGGTAFQPGYLPLEENTPEYYGPWGALNPSGDVIVENEAWREHLFRMRAPESRSPYPHWYSRAAGFVNQGIFPGMMGGGGSNALNQLLVVMDGVDNPPFFKRFRTNRVNTILDAIYILPRRYRKRGGIIFCSLFGGAAFLLMINELIGFFHGSPPVPGLVPVSQAWKGVIIAFCIWAIRFAYRGFRGARKDGTVSMRMKQVRPTGNQVYFVGATNVPIGVLDPALTRSGRMGRHIYFRTPTKEDRKDIFELYLKKVSHDPELDTPERRDEIARITAGYAPADIEQICSMALTSAHHTGRTYFEWNDLVQAMTVFESGTAVDVQFIEEDQRATAIHEAGHAATAHVYRPEVESSRLSIRMRGRSGGHHQSFEKEERFGKFQSMLFGELIHDVGAMAAELAFYGENSNGVGGDMQMATGLASRMAGGGAMSPLPLDLNGKTFPGEDDQASYERVMRRFEDIGSRMMNRSAAVLETGQDPRKRTYVAQFLGMALVTAYNLVMANKDKVEAVADAVMEKKEIFGDDLVRLLDEQAFEAPEIDWTDEETWPKIMNWSRDPREMRIVPEGTNGDVPQLHA
jgi:ATP-dependent Zn protease